MNIGLFTETYYPEINGVANSVYLLKTELEQMGHNIYVFTTTTPGAPENEHNVFRVPSLPCILITERRVGLFYQPKLAHIIKKLDLDLIHTHTEFSLGIFGRIMAKELKLPLVHTYHTIYEDYTHYFAPSRFMAHPAKAAVRKISRICCNTVQQVIVPTLKVKELLTNYSVYRDIEVIPTGIDLKKFDSSSVSAESIYRMKNRYHIGADEHIILYLGRISKEKNLSELLDIMPEYMELHQDVRFLIVGDGPDKENIRQKVSELNLENRIIFTGEQPWDTISLFYHMGDVFVSASQSETQGLTYIEAMAAGLPVVAKKDPCLENILDDGYNGYAFTTREEFIRALDKILYSGQYDDFCMHSIKKASAYSTKEFAVKVECLYRRVLESFNVRLEFES